jgi:hypothetical protein
MPFKKGQSGNPGGRPKASKLPADVRDACRSKTQEAVVALYDVLMRKGSGPMARVAAAKEILDRGWGKAPQAIALGVRGAIDLSGMTTDEMADALMAQMKSDNEKEVNTVHELPSPAHALPLIETVTPILSEEIMATIGETTT